MERIIVSVPLRALTVSALVLLGAQSGRRRSHAGGTLVDDRREDRRTDQRHRDHADGDVLSGRIVKVMPKPGDPANPVCRKCDGPEKDQPISA